MKTKNVSSNVISKAEQTFTECLQDNDIPENSAESFKAASIKRFLEAIERSIEKGLLEEKIAIAKIMLKKNHSLAEIIDLTKLSEEEIKKLN